jgi:hypothetical protein
MLGSFLRHWLRARNRLADSYDAALLLGLGACFLAIRVTNITSPVIDSLRPGLLLAFVMAEAVSLIEHGQAVPQPRSSVTD